MSINDAQPDKRRHNWVKRVALIAGLSVLALAPAMSASAAPVPSGDIVVIAGTGTAGSTTTTLATTTQLYYPNGVAVDSGGNVYIADTFHHTVRKVTPAGLIANIAGTGTAGSTNTTIATTTQLNYPIGVAVDAVGNVYIADMSNNVVRKVTPAGGIATIAGTGTAGSTTTTTATTTQLSGPRGVAVDSGGNVYIADTNNHVVRKVTPAGGIATIAGTGAAGSTTTTTAITTQLYSPGGVGVDVLGNVYIADTNNHLIRKVTPAGAIATIAGTGTAGSTATGIAITTQLSAPNGVSVDAFDNVYIADTNNHVIRKVTPTGGISTIAGTGTPGSTTTTKATTTQLWFPAATAIDSAGNVFIVDNFNSRILEVGSAFAPALTLDHFPRTVGTNNLGEPERFWIDGPQVIHSYRTNGTWSAPSTLGGPPGGIRSTEVGNELNYLNNAELYVVGNDGQVWHDFATPGQGSGWSGWYPMGKPAGPNPISGQVVVGRNYLNNQELYVLAGGQVYHSFATPGQGSGWSGWDPLGAPTPGISGDVHVSRNYLNNQELYVTAPDGQVYHKFSTPGQGSGWSGWDPMGSPANPLGDVAVWRNWQNNQEMFRVAGNTIWHNYATPGVGSGWSGWNTFTTPTGVILNGWIELDAAAPAGNLTVWVQDVNGHYWSASLGTDSNWSTWTQTTPTP